MSQFDFRHMSALLKNGGLRFAVADHKATADELRRLADMVERGDAIMQGGQFLTTIHLEDFLMHELRITFAEREPEPPKTE